MTRIFLSHSYNDKHIAMKIIEGLSEPNITVFSAVESITVGVNWRNALEDNLKSADIIIVLVTENFEHSKGMQNEVIAAKGYVQVSNQKFILPVIIDNAPIPDILWDIQVLKISSVEVGQSINLLKEAIISIMSRIKAEQDKKQEEVKRIENNSTEYIDEALKLLGKRENKNKIYANICYIMGYLMLLVGAFWGLINLKEWDLILDIKWYQCLYLGAKGLILICFLAACSKYAFNLGKAYMNESLKNADRMHAISFGRFYLKSYGEKATWDELKEVFQHWNLDKKSFFTDLKSDEFDPRIVEIVMEVCKKIPDKK